MPGPARAARGFFERCLGFSEREQDAGMECGGGAANGSASGRNGPALLDRSGPSDLKSGSQCRRSRWNAMFTSMKQVLSIRFG